MSVAWGRSRRLGWFVGLLALWMVACGTAPGNIQQNPDENSGGDGERGRAQRIELNEAITDNVSYAEGDMTDWKYVQIPGPGHIVVTLGCDYGGAACVAVVRDEVGAALTTLDSEGEPRVRGTVSVDRGNYYVQVYAQASATAYTLQVDYEPN